MYKHKLPKEVLCPLDYGTEIIGGKWKPKVICILAAHGGNMRYSAIRHELGNITDTVLSGALREMLTCGIVERTQHCAIPPRVEYSLTEKGASVLPILKSICSWSRKHSQKILDTILSPCKECGCEELVMNA